MKSQSLHKSGQLLVSEGGDSIRDASEPRLNPFISQVNYWATPKTHIHQKKKSQSLHKSGQLLVRGEVSSIIRLADDSLNPFISQVNYWNQHFKSKYADLAEMSQSLHKSGQLLVKAASAAQKATDYIVSIPS